jgi:hypothetical protein
MLSSYLTICVKLYGIKKSTILYPFKGSGFRVQGSGLTENRGMAVERIHIILGCISLLSCSAMKKAVEAKIEAIELPPGYELAWGAKKFQSG